MNSEIATDQVENGPAAEDRQAPEEPATGRRATDEQAPKDQDALLGALGTSQDSVDALVGELRALDAQLEALGGERNQHRLLHEVCDALGELGKLGAAQLFWGTREATAKGEDQLGRVRERVSAFEKRVGEM